MSEGVCPLRNSSWSFLHCPEEDECANGHHHCNSTQDCHDLPQGFHCTCKQGYILSRYEQRSACKPQSLNKTKYFTVFLCRKAWFTEVFFPPNPVLLGSVSQSVHKAVWTGLVCLQELASATLDLLGTTVHLSAAATNTATVQALTNQMFVWSATTTPL